jgi:hypothetical protein
MLLDILEEKAPYVMGILKRIGGVVVADKLEGHPNTLVIMEATDRQRLAELIMPVLDSVDSITGDVHLLINRENMPALCFHSINAESLQKQSVN